jgi:hypothetical protein
MSGTRECLPMATNLGRLPYREPSRAWAGHGNGTGCQLCLEPIESHEIEYEIELDEEGAEPLVLHMHVECYLEWASAGG